MTTRSKVPTSPLKGSHYLLWIPFKNHPVKTKFLRKNCSSSCSQQLQRFHWRWLSDLFRQSSLYLAFRISNNHPDPSFIRFTKHFPVEVNLPIFSCGRTPTLRSSFTNRGGTVLQRLTITNIIALQSLQSAPYGFNDTSIRTSTHHTIRHYLRIL